LRNRHKKSTHKVLKNFEVYRKQVFYFFFSSLNRNFSRAATMEGD
jgi:hypothetical protein